MDGICEKMDILRRNLVLVFLTYKRWWRIIIKKIIFESEITTARPRLLISYKMPRPSMR